MNSRILPSSRLLAAAILLLIGLLQTGATPARYAENFKPIPYSRCGHGPRLILLHDSSLADQRWAQAAQALADRFEIVLLDVSEIVSDTRAAQRLRKRIESLGVHDVRLAGSAHAESLVLAYALTFPLQTQSFILPQNSEDLEILAQLVNSTPFTRS